MEILKRYKIEIGIVCTVIVIQLSYILLAGAPINWFDSAVYDTIAWNFVRGLGFNYTPGIPDALREPGYTLFVLSPIYAVVGHSVFAAQVTQAILSGCTALLIYKIGKKFLTKQIGVIAVIVYTIHPAIIVNVGEIMTETWFMFLITAFVYVMLCAVESKSWRWFVLAGGILGITALTRIAALPLIGVIPIILLLQTRDWKFAIKYSLIVTVVFTAVYSPWLVRNYVVFDRLVAGRTGGGEIIWTGTYTPWDGDWQGYIWPLSEYQNVTDYFEYDNKMIALAKQNIQEDPAGVAWLWAKKPLKIFFLSDGLGGLLTNGAFKDSLFFSISFIILSVIHVILLFFAGLGFLQIKKNKKLLLIIALILVYFALIYLPLNAIPRYAVPLYPLIILVAGIGISESVSQLKQWKSL